VVTTGTNISGSHEAWQEGNVTFLPYFTRLDDYCANLD